MEGHKEGSQGCPEGWRYLSLGSGDRALEPHHVNSQQAPSARIQGLFGARELARESVPSGVADRTLPFQAIMVRVRVLRGEREAFG